MHITGEQLKSYRQQVQTVYSKFTKKETATKICGIMSPIVFLLISWMLTYCGILYLDRTAPVEEQTLAKLDFINNLCDPIMKALQFGVRPWFIVLPLCILVIILIPFATNVIITLLVSIFGKGKKLPNLPTQHIPQLKKLIFYAETSDKYILNPLEDSCRLINWLYMLFLGIIFVYIYVSLKFALFMFFYTVIGFALVATVLFWIYRLFLLAFGGLSGLLWKHRVEQSTELVKNMKNDLATEERLKKEEAKRQQNEEQRKIAAQKKKEADAKKKEADALYAKATENEEYDEELIKKAAVMGSPEACLYHGKKLIEQWSTEPLTRAEKTDLIKIPASFLSTAAPYSTEANFLWFFARTQYETNSKDKWNSILKNVRKIKSSGKLPEEYKETCDLLLETLVDVVDTTPEVAPPTYHEPNLFTDKRDYHDNRTLSYAEKSKYINENCYGMFSYTGIQTIENDSNLSASQKEDLKTFLKIYGD